MPCRSKPGARPGPRRRGGRRVAPAFAGGQVARGSWLGVLGNRDIMDTPFSAASYTETTIRNTQAVSVGDLLTRTDPSVRASIGSGNRYDALTIRGFRVDNREFALNGLYGLVPDYRISPAPLERIEVLKGPAAFLFGASMNGSVAGTVNVVTKRAVEEPLNRVTVDYASPAAAGRRSMSPAATATKNRWACASTPPGSAATRPSTGPASATASAPRPRLCRRPAAVVRRRDRPARRL
ncbi:TonB-dependent receptor plug domain-containing protein [Methylobacterium persicinum]